MTHFIGWGLGQPRSIGLTITEAAAIDAAAAEARAAYEASPEGRRSALARAVTEAGDAWEDLREQVHDDPQKWPAAVNAEGALNDAMAALDAFDAVHPEMTAAREAQNQKRIAAAIDSALNS